MNLKIGIPGIVFVLLLISCSKDWDEHYKTTVPTSNVNVWDALQADENLSTFVNYLKEYRYDTLFQTNNTYTIFAPDNEAFTEFLTSRTINKAVMDYHISTFFIQSGSIEDKRKIQTLAEKFALFIKNPFGIFLDDVPIVFESPIYKNGKYFKLDKVALPKPNLYEYISATNPVLKRYIDDQDSIIVDKELSRPIGFDEHGNTIYDTVAIIYNEFEATFFPVKEEFRYQTATIVFPKEENYNNALTKMTLSLNCGYNDYNDVPMEWQDKILIPYLLEHGVFENMVEQEEFLEETVKDTIKMKNILGDSIVIDYVPSEKTICSNGYAYNYENFEVPDTLYAAPIRIEAEMLTRDAGGNRYFWNDDVTVINDVSYLPVQEYITGASNDSILKVNFTKGYKGKFSVEFNVDNLFPRKYLMVFGTNMYVGGIYEIYVNGILLRTFDYYEYVPYRGVIYSVTGTRYLPKGSYNKFDCWLDNLTEYGKAKVKIVYTGPSTVLYNGLVLDYIEFIPN
jgi:uncharacterized surface protein with fasciclin (FAS1) repeats